MANKKKLSIEQIGEQWLDDWSARVLTDEELVKYHMQCRDNDVEEKDVTNWIMTHERGVNNKIITL